MITLYIYTLARYWGDMEWTWGKYK